MTLFFIGLGLGDEKDITLKGLQILQSCDYLFLESYTSILHGGTETIARLKELIQANPASKVKEIFEADREFVELNSDDMLEHAAKGYNVGFLVVGDPFCATTHSDMFLRAVEKGIKVEIVHNASIISAVGACGLQVYRFGEIVSLPFFTEKWKPYSYYDRVIENRKRGLHTLVLLDIKVKEPTEESLLRGKKVYEKPRFMSSQVAAVQLIETEVAKSEKAYAEDTKCFALARIGSSTQKIVAGELKKFAVGEGAYNMGDPLHSFVICAEELHPIEEEMYNYYKGE